MSVLQTKVCRRCGEEKAISLFPPRHDYEAPCKACRATARRKQYAEDAAFRARHIVVVANQRAGKLGLGPCDVRKGAELILSAECCEYCGCKETKDNRFALDHRQPLARGGTQDIENLTVACQRCNFAKRVSTEAEYRTWLQETAERLLAQ